MPPGPGTHCSRAAARAAGALHPPTAAMGSGRVLVAGAVLVALVALGARLAASTRPSAFFQWSATIECHFLNGTERVRFLVRHVYNRQQYVHFDSDVGLFVADAVLGESSAKFFNSQQDVLEKNRAAVEMLCNYNYEIVAPLMLKKREPKVRISALQSGSLPQTDRLACYVTGFYPPEIEVKWFQNGQEETESVVSTDVIQNGDWTYQVLVVLETSPRHGDSYVCQVEHASLWLPITQLWEPLVDEGRSKLLMGVGGIVLGLICLVLGLFLFLHSKKGVDGLFYDSFPRWRVGYPCNMLHPP
ncbi:class II histocompatibility antigen, B-L beta chain-like isoform X2 [Coturnix japonica]|uniref:class II histocompatibility antigen, B-L beta chain-like isoform X2 n=1 Tax=Coturnix japonica TaxID=93934 RepID=UPI0007776CC6|nr:class II histocompatibility antigen, B-L beta chain-like isoform X2 [Coturnix japonica]